MSNRGDPATIQPMTRPATNLPSGVTWRTHLSLLLLSLVYIFSYIDRQVIAVVIEPIKHEFGLSDSAMGVLSGLAFGVMYAGLGIPVGRFADSHSRRKIAAVCATLWSLATMACGLAMNFWQMLLARMSVAVGEAGGMAPSISLISDLYPKKNRALAISVFMMGPQLGLLIGLVVGGWIAQHYGWRHAFIWLARRGWYWASWCGCWCANRRAGATTTRWTRPSRPRRLNPCQLRSEEHTSELQS